MKIAIQHLPGPGDKVHMRHLYQALLKTDAAEGFMEADGPDQERDFTFTHDSSFKPVCGKTVVHFSHDPHALATDLDIMEQLDPKMQELSLKLGTPPDYHVKRAEEFKARIPYSMVPYLKTFDVYAPALTRPLRTHYEPLLERPTFVIPHTAPAWIFNGDPEVERPLDFFFIGASGQAYYPLRCEILGKIKTEHRQRLSFDLPPYSLPSCADLNATWTNERFDSHQSWYADQLRKAKVCAFDGSVFLYPLSRYIECMLAGCLVVATMPWDGEELGFKDGVNMVAIDPDNWEEKLFFYLENDDERLKITREAHRFVHENHSCEARAKLIVKDLEAIK